MHKPSSLSRATARYPVQRIWFDAYRELVGVVFDADEVIALTPSTFEEQVSLQVSEPVNHFRCNHKKTHGIRRASEDLPLQASRRWFPSATEPRRTGRCWR